MLDRGANQWVDLCNHLNSNKFKKASSANIVNRSKKKYNHRIGSRPFSYIVEKMTEDETLFKEYEYLIERAKEQQLPKDNPLEEIPIDDPDVEINIMMSVLGTKPCRRILGLGDGCLRDIAILSSNVHTLGKELEAECAARKVVNAARVNMEQNKLKVFEQQFNSTLQSWYHSMHQLCGKVPGFIVPPFIPLSIENTGNGKDDAIEDEKNDFGENQCMSNLRD